MSLHSVVFKKWMRVFCFRYEFVKISKQLTQPLKVEYVINMEILLQGMNEVIQIKAPLLIRLVGEHIKSAAHQSKKKKP